MEAPKVFMRLIMEPDRLFHAIQRAFDGDEDLPLYHRKTKGLINTFEMARHTHSEIIKNRKVGQATAKWYTVYAVTENDTQLIGFTVIFRNPVPILYSFGIKKEYRNKEILTAWLKCVDERFMGKVWATVINLKNTRAIRFFERNGFRQDRIDKVQKIVSLIPVIQDDPVENNSLCHFSEE
jgi:RimJ/RimL family protein N-acetyltransferase